MELLTSFGLQDAKSATQVMVVASFIWFFVVGCAVASIIGQPFSKKQRFFWIMMVVGIPVVGMLAYLPFAVQKENYPGLFNTSKKR